MKEKIDIRISKESVRNMMNQIEEPDFLEEDLLNLKIKNNGRSNRKHLPKWCTVAACMAAVLLIGTGAFAAAKTWLFSDFFQQGEVKEDVNKVVNTEVSASEMQDRSEDEFGNKIQIKGDVNVDDILTLKPTMTVCDSCNVYVGFEAVVKDTEKYILLDDYLDLDSDAAQLTGDESSDESLKEYCKKQKKTMIRVSGNFLFNDKEVNAFSSKSKYDEKGNVQYLLIGKCKGKDMSDEISIVYQVQVYNEDTNCFEVIADKIQNVGIAEVREEEVANYGFADGKEHRIGDTSIFISKVTLTSTAIATYTEIYVRNEDSDYGNWVAVHVVGNNHEFLQNGPQEGGLTSIPGDDGCFVVEEDYARFDELPDTVCVRAHNLQLDNEDLPVGYIELQRID